MTKHEQLVREATRAIQKVADDMSVDLTQVIDSLEELVGEAEMLIDARKNDNRLEDEEE